MTETEKQKYIAYLSLKGELDSLRKKGAGLYLNGQQTDSSYIAGICVFNESTDYMRDYVTDKSGSLSRLSFDRVHNK